MFRLRGDAQYCWLQGVDQSCVQYFIGEVLYGGHMNDSVDRQLLKALCETAFGDNALQSSFSFHSAYSFPVCNTLDEYTEYFGALPDYSAADVLGLQPATES